MNAEEVNTQLYQKMYAEQVAYVKQLKELPPAEILNHAYEYTCREDILLSLEYNDLSPKQAQALLHAEHPLQAVFEAWEKHEGSHMAEVWNTLEQRANHEIQQQKTRDAPAK